MVGGLETDSWDACAYLSLYYKQRLTAATIVLRDSAKLQMLDEIWFDLQFVHGQ